MRAFISALTLVFALAATCRAGDSVIFLLDSSISEQKDAYAGRVAKIKEALEKDKDIERFQVLSFDVSARWLDAGALLKNDEEQRAKAIKTLETVVPEGARDIEAALAALGGPALAEGTKPRVIVLTDGPPSWGEPDPAALVAAFRKSGPHDLRFEAATDGGKELVRLLNAGAAQLPAPVARADAFKDYVKDVDSRVHLLDGKGGEHVKLLLKFLSSADFELPQRKANKAVVHQKDVPEDYLRNLRENPRNAENYVTEAARRLAAKDKDGMVRALSSLVALYPADPDVQRSVGYRLLDAGLPYDAIRIFEKLRKLRPDDAHSYRDLARALEDGGKQGMASIQYEVLLAGTWDPRRGSLKEVVEEEYGHMLRDAIRNKKIPAKLMDPFGERLESMDANKLQADLRVAISWNTDNTDVDLWVIEPDGTKCFYGHRQTRNGGELTQDVTQGYGPERYQMVKAKPGEYAIQVHFFSGPRNAQVVDGTHVNVVVRRNAGTPQEESQRFTVILRRQNDRVEVCKMKY